MINKIAFLFLNVISVFTFGADKCFTSPDQFRAEVGSHQFIPEKFRNGFPVQFSSLEGRYGITLDVKGSKFELRARDYGIPSSLMRMERKEIEKVCFDSNQNFVVKFKLPQCVGIRENSVAEMAQIGRQWPYRCGINFNSCSESGPTEVLDTNVAESEKSTLISSCPTERRRWAYINSDSELRKKCDKACSTNLEICKRTEDEPCFFSGRSISHQVSDNSGTRTLNLMQFDSYGPNGNWGGHVFGDVGQFAGQGKAGEDLRKSIYEGLRRR